MKLWMVEQDFEIIATDTHFYEIRAETREDAIAMVESGNYEPINIRRTGEDTEVKLIGYEDTHEIKY